MPTYEYECRDCGKSFVLQRTIQEHVDKKKPKCPECNKSQAVHQVISSVYVQTSKKS
jgi:putative FmdB family regulatory protein